MTVEAGDLARPPSECARGEASQLRDSAGLTPDFADRDGTAMELASDHPNPRDAPDATRSARSPNYVSAIAVPLSADAYAASMTSTHRRWSSGSLSKGSPDRRLPMKWRCVAYTLSPANPTSRIS